MTLFDWFIVVVIVVSMIVAASQGFLLEVFALAGLILGLWVAMWNYPVLAVPFSHVIRSVAISDALAFLLIALGIMILFGLLGRLISRVAQTAGLGGLDSLLGALFGIVRGAVLVVIAIVAIAAFFPQKTWMDGSRLAPYFLSAANQVSAGAPEELKLKIQEGVAILKHLPPVHLQWDLHRDPRTR